MMRIRQLVRLILSLALALLGILCFSLPLIPGECSNIVAWLESDGRVVAYAIGTALLLAGLVAISHSIRQFKSFRMSIHKGPLRCSIEQGILQGIVERLWSEFFEQTAPTVHVSLHKQTLRITGNVPQGRESGDDLAAYLSRRLLVLAGYWGDIQLVLSHEDTPEG